MPEIAVILASRGMSFSQTCEELLGELEGLSHKIFFSIGNTLPDCFNLPIEKALKQKKWTHVLIVEDDMIIPKGILKKMLDCKYPVVALDYPFVKDYEATVLHDPNGMALYTGTGFMLIERWVLDAMPKPIFRTDTAWDMMITKDNKLVCWARDVSNIKTYGLHDVHFGITLWSNDMPIFVMKEVAGQRKLVKKGKSGSNSGADKIIQITKVLKNNTTRALDANVVKAYLDRLEKVDTIEILEKKPKNVYYEDGQARVGAEHVVI